MILFEYGICKEVGEPVRILVDMTLVFTIINVNGVFLYILPV